jgi:hypothetical protein
MKNIVGDSMVVTCGGGSSRWRNRGGGNRYDINIPSTRVVQGVTVTHPFYLVCFQEILTMKWTQRNDKGL